MPWWFSRMNSVENFAGKARTGIWGLDNILSGGFSRGHVFLVEGAPGTGKTTVALQFLLEGARAGEKCLYITLSETGRELRDGAASHGWVLDDRIDGRGLTIGGPLDGFQGILRGVPIYIGEGKPLLEERAP